MRAFAMRVAIFVISLLLVTGAVEPGDGWFVALAVLSGLSLVRFFGDGPRIYIGRRRADGLRWIDD